MTFSRRLTLFAFFFVASAFPVLNLPASAANVATPKQDWFYVPSDSLPATLLPPPPSPNSPEGRRQIQAVIQAQLNVGQKDYAAMRDEQHVRLELMTQVLGPGFTRANNPKAFALLDHVMADTRTVTEIDKFFWHTQRPYLVDKRVKLLVGPIYDNPAYPSGHTCFSRVVAEVLGMIYPDRLADLRARADSIAWHRVEAGVHYPVDVDGGKILAMQLIGAFMQSDAFLDDLDDARHEAAHN